MSTPLLNKEISSFEQFFQAVKDDLILNYEERVLVVSRLLSEYEEKHGKRPDDDTLERLADAILKEIKPKQDEAESEKVTKDYKVLSDSQKKRRTRRENLTGDGSKIAGNGKYVENPNRRERSNYENIRVDSAAKIRNEERRKRYNEFTKVQDVDTYHISELNRD